MIQDLPDALKEELIFHKFGNMIFKFHFLTKNGSSNLVWDMLKNLNKLTFDVNDTIYLDNSLANTIYLIHDGYVKLFAENGFAFQVYRLGTNFGDSEVILGLKSNGTAKAMC